MANQNLSGDYFIKNGQIIPIKGVSGIGQTPLDRFNGVPARDPAYFDNSPEGLAKAYEASVWSYRCTTARAYAIGGIPLLVKTQDDEYIDRSGNAVDERVSSIADQHILQVFLGAGNTKLLRNTSRDLDIWGRAFWIVTKLGIERLNPMTIEIEADMYGIKQFRQVIMGQVIATWEPDELIYFFDYDPLNDLNGLSLLALSLRSVGVEVNIQEFVKAFFENDATPGGLLTTDQKVQANDVEETRRWWQKLFRGVKKKHSVGIAGSGFKYQAITPPIVDLAIPVLREETRREICAAFGVPPTVALATDAANYATSKEQHIAFYTGTIIPQMDFIVDEINKQLVPLFGEGIKVVPDYTEIDVLQEDKTMVAQRAQLEFTAGFLSMNDAREMVDLPPVDDQGNDYYFIQGFGLYKPEELGDAKMQPVPPAPPGGGGGLFGLQMVSLDHLVHQGKDGTTAKQPSPF
jgi:HK97 family phage portal protein